MIPDPIPELTDAQRRLIVLVAGGATFTQIAADPATWLQPAGVRDAIDAVLAATGTRTPAHLAAWATARRFVTEPVRPCGALVAAPALARRHQQVLRGWAGGMTDHDLVADFGVAWTTVRSYGKAVFAGLGVGCASQAVVVGVLAGLVLLSDIDSDWPAQALAGTASSASGGPAAGRTDTAGAPALVQL
ncbi:hypothetical protein ACI1MP_10440 [Kitasatospora griseola]|uniref:hypothetical protein n=1 Tax=Kitasatospora griseola TaxID=2064 RepID=UPI003855DD69